MVLTKECRICMPLTVEELYMMARHSYQQTECGQGVEIIMNEACEDPKHGKGQYIEKRIHLNGRLPYRPQSILPKVFYITEKAWNYYPYTFTRFQRLFTSNIAMQNLKCDNCEVIFNNKKVRHAGAA